MCDFLFNISAIIISIVIVILILLANLEGFNKFNLIQTLIILCLKSLAFGLLAVYAVSVLIEFLNFAVDIYSIIYNNLKQSISDPLNSKDKYLFALFVISASLLFLYLIYLKRNVFLAYTQRKHIAPDTSEIITIESVDGNGVGTTTYKGKKWLVFSFICHLDCNKQYRLTELSKSFLFVTNIPKIGDIITVTIKKTRKQ